MKDVLPQKVKNIQCGIQKLEDSDEEGSHLAACYKNNNIKYCFDSYGNIHPPKELATYLGPKKLFYSEEMLQNYADPPVCVHLCLLVLGKKLSRGESYEEILKDLKIDDFWTIESLKS
jgi:hypothetical protein